MKKAIFAIFLFFAALSGSSAAEDRTDIAVVEKRAYISSNNRGFSPLLREKIEYYEICGSCETDLRNEMREKGCSWKDGKKYHSLTTWSLKWDYHFNQTSQTCSVDSFRPIIDITIRYPKWSNTQAADPQLVEKWGYYMKNLITHEEGHRDMVMEAALEISRDVSKLPPAPTCADMEREVKKLCRLGSKQLDDDAKVYDAETRHGLTQGAVFP